METKKIRIDTLVVGAGQSGVVVSEHLTKLDVPHLVVERNRIAEQWRTGRWDAMLANGPAWHDRLPNLEFEDVDPDAFPSKDRVADYIEEYAKKFAGFIRTGVEVLRVERNIGRTGFTVETSGGLYEVDHIVVATGAFQRPVIPDLVPADFGITQMHSAAYHNPQQLPDGAVLVVGAGSSGTQIAVELQRAGRQVYFSVGKHERPPRAYRSRDIAWWMGVLGYWDRPSPPGSEHVTVAIGSGRTLDFRRMAHEGMILVGRAKTFVSGKMAFEDGLAANLAGGDASYFKLLDAADKYVSLNGINFPEDPEARLILPDPPCVTDPIMELDLEAAGISTIIWATGYDLAYDWLKFDVFDEKGRPIHQRGVSSERGLYFIGLPWLSRHSSSFLCGVWHDAWYVANHIATQRKMYAV